MGTGRMREGRRRGRGRMWPRGERRARCVVLALLLGWALAVALPADAYARDHRLAFTTDYHASADSLTKVLEQMPDDTEYVSIVGDLVGDFRDMYPAYTSSEMLGKVRQALPSIASTDVSIVWASHDRNVEDDAGIVVCLGGDVSEAIRVAREPDGSVAYCVYAIGFNDMCAGEEQSKRAAAAFKAWVDGIDPCVPVIVVCHVPLHAARGDNRGAPYWSEALNYAATGIEGLTGVGTSARVVRNVVFLHGHNHTIDETEYLYLPGSTMKVAADVERKRPEPRPRPSGEGGGQQSPPDGAAPSRPRPEAEGADATVYFTSLTAGYLKTSGAATLVSVTDDAVALTKYGPDGVCSLGTDAAGGNAAADTVSLAAFRRRLRRVDASVRVTSADAAGMPAPCAVIGVFDAAGTLVATLTAAPTATLSTADASLAGLLPAAGDTATFELRELSAPTGYARSVENRTLVVTATQDERLDDHTYVCTTTYAFAVDGQDEVVFHHVPSAVPQTPAAWPYATQTQTQVQAPWRPSSGGAAGVADSPTKSAAARLAGASRYDTMAEVVGAAFASSEWAVIATGESHADALAASSLAGVHDAPVILTAPSSLSAQARDLIVRLGVRHAVILGGPAAVGEAVVDELGAMGIDCVRVWGQDRRQTAVRALEEARAAGSVSDTVCVVSGTSFADALSVGPLCYAEGIPLVLTRPDGTLDETTVAAITADARIANVLIVGGAGVVSDAVRDQLGSRYAYTRLGGADRYGTSAAVARWAQGRGLGFAQVAVATGRNFPDALAASALCGARRGSLLLMDAATDATFALAREHVSRGAQVTAIGGTAAVGESLLAALMG